MTEPGRAKASPSSLPPHPAESSKTPHFEAIHALRYLRQEIIGRIQKQHGTTLLCYIAGIDAPVSRGDIVGWADLLHNVSAGSPIDVLLQTPGGDIDAAEKMWRVLRARAGEADIRVIVADYAKSAGTLMALGADWVVMSESSELGPIDPQISLTDGSGNRFTHSIINYLDAHESATNDLKANPNDTAAQIRLGKLNPATVMWLDSVRQRAQRLAEDQLKMGMFRGGRGNTTLTAKNLMKGNFSQTHGQMIGWQDAQDARIALRVQYMAPESDEWREIWSLYCLQQLAVGDSGKLFESDCVSLLEEEG